MRYKPTDQLRLTSTCGFLFIKKYTIMAKVRMVNTRIRADWWVLDLDPSEKLLWIYLLTNSHVDLCWIYEIHIRTIAMETWFDKDMIEKVFNRFIKDGKIRKEENWVYIINFSKHQSKNPSIEKWIQRSLETIPKAILDSLYAGCTQAVHSLVHSNLNLNSNLNSNSNWDQNQKSQRSKHRQTISLEEFMEKIKPVIAIRKTEWYKEKDLLDQWKICWLHHEEKKGIKTATTAYNNWITNQISWNKISKPKRTQDIEID